MLLFVGCLIGFCGQVFAADKPGLVGIQYGSEDFSDPDSLYRVEHLECNLIV